jgi:hypothetical protein
MIDLTHDHTWSPRRALEEQVAKEDLLAWALRDDAPVKPVPPLKAERWPAAPLHVLKSQLRQLIA